MDRKKATLAVLLFILAIAIFYSFVRTPRQKSVPALPNKPGSVAKAPRAPASAALDNTKVQLELLQKGAPRFTGYKRNIFRPIFREEPVIAATPRSGAAAPPPSPPPPPPPPPPEPTPLQRDLGRFTFLGFLKKDQNKVIFLGKDREIFLVRAGDVIAGKYKTVAITDQVMTIRQLEDGGEIVIPLVENAPLVASPGR